MNKEEFKITDKTALESKNLCKNCNKILNVTPIICILENDSVREICGRCSYQVAQLEGKKWRQYAYENFAQFLTYPCSNKKFGCDAILNWNQVLDHEIACTFQTTACPLSYTHIFPDKNCDWSGNVKKLNEHIEDAHKDCFVSPPQFDWLDSTINSIFFTHVGSQLVTVVIKHEIGNKFHCLVMVNGNDIESQCYRYQLELFNENRDNSIILRKSRLEPLGCILENFKNPTKMLEIDVDVIKEMLRITKGIHGKFGIVRKNKKEILQLTGIKDPEVLNGCTTPLAGKSKIILPDEPMLQELECPVCNEYMIPPIYICQAGHSICSECKLKVANCPNCRSQFSGARNFTLEKLTTRVHYPCKNREIGCSFVTTSDRIRGHESSCELSETPCILRCAHRCLRPSMYNHLTEKHANSLLAANTLHIRDVSDKKESFHVLYVFGELFRFSIKGSGFNPYKFNVQHQGMAEEEPVFKYELQFVDESPLGLNLSMTNSCQVLTDVPNKAHANAVNVPWEMLKPFIFDNKYFYFKIMINRI
ncbi:unnamed protein product [Phaedon cochleariae]|uniref:RING-type E3 ubiquitin transferase n=1 Tax=Phaedon cochleariae TaxID=80249 RepID=A0A9N9SGF4_PHACE|nr:unnamed protein product [Phaedon cochleariae]